VRLGDGARGKVDEIRAPRFAPRLDPVASDADVPIGARRAARSVNVRGALWRVPDRHIEDAVAARRNRGYGTVGRTARSPVLYQAVVP
jgi:hypothetical protein